MLPNFVRADGTPLSLSQMILTLIACSAVAALWAVFRPDLVRDNDGRRLPASVTARLTFTILFVCGYLAMAAAFLFGGFIFVKSLSSLTGAVPKFIEDFDNQALVLALFASFGLYSFAPFREIERNVLSWMHDTRHLRTDIKALTEHLEECAFNVSSEEQNRNRKSLEALEVYITDNDAKDIDIESVIAWRKTASLLRHVREWNAVEPRALSPDEMELLSDLEHAHARKTRLAVDIIRLLDSVREGADAAGAISAVSDMLASASHANRPGVARAEAEAQVKIETDSQPARPRPVRITSSQLREYMKKIEGYFLIEYRLLLERVAKLAAKSVVHAGDAADVRLDELKAIGFAGLGSIRPLSAHRILWLFMSVAIGGFLIYYYLWYDAVLQRLRTLPDRRFTEAQIASIGQNMLIGIGFFVLTIAFAALIGSLFGSSSTNARGKEAPWGKYAFAGLVAIAVYFMLQLIREVVLHASGLAPVAALTGAEQWASRIKLAAPWCVLPFSIAVTICWLARQNPWQAPRAVGEGLAITLQRLQDGLVLGLVMIPGFSIAIAILQMTGLPLPPVLQSRFDVPVIMILGILGFFVGAVVVRDVRSAAHAQVVEPKARENRRTATNLALSQAAH